MPDYTSRLKADADPLLPGGPLRFHDLQYEVRQGVARITLDRATSHNSYTTAMLADLIVALRTATLDDAVGVIVLTGTGTKAFCTGGDVKEYATRYTQKPRDYWKYMGLFRGVVEGLLNCGKPTIARLNGMAIGGGNELHLACDLSVAASHASLGQVGVGVGSVACGGATQWLSLAVGDRRARAMLLLNERVPASTALEWGLVTQVANTVTQGGKAVQHPSPEAIAKAQAGLEGYAIDLAPLDQAVDAMATRLLGMFPECLRYTKEQTNFWKNLSWHATVGHAQDWLTLHFANLEPYEGMQAFAQKRPVNVRALRDRIAAGGSGEFLHGPPARTCGHCGASGLPAAFDHCGKCGKAL